MRLHVVSLPHTETTRAYEWCAYSSKVRKFADMMSGLGHEVVLYAGARNEGDCVECVDCTGGNLPPNGEIPPFDSGSPLFAEFNARAIDAMRERLAPRDFICLIGGLAQAPMAEAFPTYQVVEFGIGYGGIIPATHHVFESYAWMHTVTGALTWGDSHAANGRFFDGGPP